METAGELVRTERLLRFRADEGLVMQLAALAVVDEASLSDVINDAFIRAIQQRRADPQLPQQVAVAEIRLRRDVR